jgi:hypothetical protein
MLTRLSRASDAARILSENRKAIQGTTAILNGPHAASRQPAATALRSTAVNAFRRRTIFDFTRKGQPGILGVLGGQKTIFDPAVKSQPGVLGVLGRQKPIFDPFRRQVGTAGISARRESRVGVEGLLGANALHKAVATAATLSGVAKPPRVPAVPRLADYGRVHLRTVMANGGVISRTVRVPAINLLSLVPSEARKETRELYEALQRVEGAWADDALWFLFSRLTHKDMFLFDRLDGREQVEAATLDALELVLREGTFVKLLCEALEAAPYISEYQRDILIHALQHVRGGDYRLAISHLLDGLEGAIIRAAMGRAVIDENRWLIGKPREKRNRRHGVDAIVSEMSLGREYERFLHRGVFGKRGNAARHGDIKDNERRRALLLVAAIAGWTDIFMSLKASETLVDAMTIFLPETVARQRRLTT